MINHTELIFCLSYSHHRFATTEYIGQKRRETEMFLKKARPHRFFRNTNAIIIIIKTTRIYLIFKKLFYKKSHVELRIYYCLWE